MSKCGRCYGILPGFLGEERACIGCEYNPDTNLDKVVEIAEKTEGRS